MKKSLIALAALATVATAAQAQSSVTLYGIVDAAVTKVSGIGAADNNVTGIGSGGLSSSRWGVRGTEDLGAGLTAGFNLESELDTGTGVGGSTTQVTGGSNASTVNLFNRAANVSLGKADLGTVTLGRKNRLDYDLIVALDPTAGANVGSVTRVGYIQGGLLANGDARLSDSVTLQSASYAGLSVAYQHQFGETAGDNTKYRTTGYSIGYKAGDLMLAAAYSSSQADQAANKHNTTLIGGTYDLKVVKVFAGHAEREKNGVSPKTKLDFVGAVVPVTSKVNLIANYMSVKNWGGAASAASNVTPADGKKADAYGLGATYAFSNRTTGYALFGTVDNQGGAYLASTSILGAAPDANKRSTTTAVGLRHSF